jgi:hypothetical protein
MPTIQKPYPDCGQMATFTFGETIHHNRLAWFASHNCDYCSYRVEIDDYGHLPDELKRVVLKEESQWKLVLHSFGTNKIATLKELREILRLSVQGLTGLLTQLPGTIAIGTRNEMDYLKSRLKTVLNDTEIEILPPDVKTSGYQKDKPTGRG